MASDGQRIVLFGGNQFDGQPTPGVSYHIVADTWTFDGTTWSRYLGKQPPARQEAGMAADSAGLVMFGGDYVSNTRFEIFADTWLWRAGRWTQAPTAHAPSKRRGPLLGYDVASHRTVLFGGNDRVIYNDTWTWNGKDWRMARPTKQPDATSDGAPMVFNGAELIQFNSFAGTTWAWADGNWRQLTTAHSPGNRQSPGMAGDPAGGVVLFGGVDANGPAAHFNSDTWRLTR